MRRNALFPKLNNCNNIGVMKYVEIYILSQVIVQTVCGKSGHVAQNCSQNRFGAMIIMMFHHTNN